MAALLRLENLAVAIAAIVAFRVAGGGWWLFALLFLVPDLFMLGYLAGPVTGARLYNLAHSYLAPAPVLGLAWMTGHELGAQVALIWVAHIGIDRVLGYGLKYPTRFADTHLGPIGRHG